MKVILDIDGTLTDFNEFVEKHAISYFISRYGMEVKQPNALEIEDIFDMENFFINKYGYTMEEAKIKTKEILKKFWVSTRFVKFSLFTKFRKGLKDYLLKLCREGHILEVHSSRGYTTQTNIIGLFAKKMTILQFRLNGLPIKNDNFHFYRNDEEKIKGIIDSSPDLVFDDKPEIINELVGNKIKCVCVGGKHNTQIDDSRVVKKVSQITKDEIDEKVSNLLGNKNIQIYERAAKSDLFFNKLKICRPFLLGFFDPIVLHKENLLPNSINNILYVSNHRSTLDPLVIMAILSKNVHWAALLRFFDGKDSIFNNNKSPLLCDLTSLVFKKLEFFPIDRKSDNPDANNFQSIIDMNDFLKNNQSIGIFPEGTTRREEGCEFGIFDESFILLAQRNDAWIQPITTYWHLTQTGKKKVVVNFGIPIKTSKKEATESIMKKFMDAQIKGLEENKLVFAENELKMTLKKERNNI